jgi:exonuclease III
MYRLWGLALLPLMLVGSTDFNCSSVDEGGLVDGGVDNRKDQNKWSVVQFNAEWLFTESCSSCPGICTWNTTVDQYTHMGVIQNILESLDADTVHLCEVQSCTQLDEVKPVNRSYVSYMIEGEDTYTGQNVGLLTKIDPDVSLTRTEMRYNYPIEGSRCQYNGENGTQGVTKHLFTHFTIHNTSIHMIGAHLLSDPNDPEKCAQREAQAKVLQAYIESKMDLEEEVIVLGDMNDYDNVFQDINNHEANSDVLAILCGKTSNYSLYSVASKVLSDERYTDFYDVNGDCRMEREDLSMIDHILVSRGLLERIESVKYIHNYREGCDTYESDHYPVMVTFYWPSEARPEKE